MILKKHFFIFYVFSVLMASRLHAPIIEEAPTIKEWELINASGVPSAETPAYQILMEQEKRARMNQLQKVQSWLTGNIRGNAIRTDPESGFVQFSRPQDIFQSHKKISDDWDIIEKESNSTTEKKMHQKALQTIQKITQYYEKIADGTQLPDASDEKILNDFLVRPELFKSFITDPNNHLFPEELRSRIQTILKDPNYAEELRQLQSAILAAKKKFIDEQQQKKQIEHEAQTRKKLDLEKQFQNTLQAIQKQEFQEHQKILQATESLQRSQQEHSQATNRTTLTQEFENILNNLKQIHANIAKANRENLTMPETEQRKKMEQDQEQEYEKLLKQYNKEQAILNANIHNPSTHTEKTTSNTTTQKQAQEQRKKQIEDLLRQSKAERERLKKEKYLEELGQAKHVSTAKFKQIMPQSLIFHTDVRQDVVEKHINELCKPFQEALDNPNSPQNLRAIHFLNHIPDIALQNGATLRQYLMLNHINTPLDITGTTLSEQNAIFDGLAIKIKQYKKDYEETIWQSIRKGF